MITPAKVSSLEALKMEKVRLKAYCRSQEKLIGYRLEHIKDNYSHSFSSAFLPLQQEQSLKISAQLDMVNDFIIKLFPGIFQKNKYAGFLLKLTQLIIIRSFVKPGKPKQKAGTV